MNYSKREKSECLFNGIVQAKSFRTIDHNKSATLDSATYMPPWHKNFPPARTIASSESIKKVEFNMREINF